MAKANGFIDNRIEIGKGVTRIRVFLGDILYLEGINGYSIFHLKERQVLSAKTLKFWQEQLPDNFMRVHRKYLVNDAHVMEIQENSVLVMNGKTVNVLPISRRKLKNLIVC